MIWSLVDETCNQMTVVTANQKPWQERISPHWEDAELARLINAPLELDGLSRYLARKMIDQRLAAIGTDRQNYNFMTNRFWLDQVFKAGGGQMGVRHFLWECSQRWEQLGPGESAEQTLEELFAGTVEKFLTPTRTPGVRPGYSALAPVGSGGRIFPAETGGAPG